MHEARLRRIQEVTRHYATFRAGVTRAACLPIFFAGLLLEFLNPTHRSVHVVLGLLNIFATAGLVVLVGLRMRRWMDLRFGRVRAGTRVITIIVPTLAIWAYMGGNYLDEKYATSADLPSLTFLGSAAYGAWLALSIGRYGLQNVLPAAVSIVAAFALIDVRDDASLEMWEVKAFFTTGLAWIVAGLVDLVLLWKTLGRKIPFEDGVADAS